MNQRQRTISLSCSRARGDIYRAYAAEAESWARHATGNETRESFQAIAARWRELAEDVQPTHHSR